MKLPFLPEQASTIAWKVDGFYFYMVAVSAFFACLVFALTIIFAIKYHRKKENEIGADIHGSLVLEIVWSVIPLLISMTMFGAATYIFFENSRPPANAEELYVVGKQWMWKLQHPEGRREINELHIPVGQAVKLTMTSEDVIHSFYVPAFRTKMDVLPGRYTHMWFQPTKAGKYHLFCAEYCGTNHSKMIGSINVMEPAHYQAWLEGRQPGAGAESMVSRGEKLFKQLNCLSCHGDVTRGPLLDGILGKKIALQGGGSVTADENYLRESIINPAAKVVDGYQPVMPVYSQQLSEEQIMDILAYLKADIVGQNSQGA